MRTRKMTILVVEDSPIAAIMAGKIFRELGCEIELVDDGSKAIEMALKNNYDGICMDIGLPDVSGLEACVAIRKHEAEQGISPVPIIAVTGNNSPEEVENYLNAGMQEVISKPLTKEMAEHFLSFCKK